MFRIRRTQVIKAYVTARKRTILSKMLILRITTKLLIKHVYLTFRSVVDYKVKKMKLIWNFFIMMSRLKARVRSVNSGDTPEERNHQRLKFALIFTGYVGVRRKEYTATSKTLLRFIRGV